MATEKGNHDELTYLDIQAAVGVSKHMGGFEATRELLSLCHIEGAQEVLDVGCGIGVGPAHIAKDYGCRVVGVDISEKMIEWSKQRARREGVQDRVELRTADVLDLPFAADRFDVVICESVLAFVEDKARAIGECIRVTKPGGYVGLNEAVWLEEPSPEKAAQAVELGTNILTVDAWQELWERSGLQDRVVDIRQIDARQEVKDRIGWIGWPGMLRAWYGFLRLYLKCPSAREFLKESLSSPREIFTYFGYALFVGRK
jgi:arsenite methyltransferase